MLGVTAKKRAPGEMENGEGLILPGGGGGLVAEVMVWERFFSSR